MKDGVLDKVNGKVEMFMGLVGLIGIIIITVNVICRFILKTSMAWSDELLRTMFIYGYFIGAATMFSAGGLMRLEILENAFEKRGMKKANRILSVVLNGINILFFGNLAYYTFGEIIIPFMVSGVSTSTSSTPAWILPMGYGLGILIIGILSVVNLIQTIFFYK